MSEQRFELFWDRYPRKVGKKPAEQKFKAAMRVVDFATLMAALDRYICDDKAHGGGKYYKHPSTWLNQHGWSDYAGVKPDKMEQVQDVGEFREKYIKAVTRDNIKPRVEPTQESKDRVMQMVRGLNRKRAVDRWRQFKEGRR